MTSFNYLGLSTPEKIHNRPTLCRRFCRFCCTNPFWLWSTSTLDAQKRRENWRMSKAKQRRFRSIFINFRKRLVDYNCSALSVLFFILVVFYNVFRFWLGNREASQTWTSPCQIEIPLIFWSGWVARRRGCRSSTNGVPSREGKLHWLYKD